MDEILALTPLLSTSLPVTVMGSSMGGHLACRLLEHIPVANLIAQVPAAYSAQAENLIFNEAFTAALKAPRSWNDSLIWPQLKSFKGNFLLISAGQDKIIPQDILNSYWSNACNAQKRTHLHLPNAEHSLAPWLNKNQYYLASYHHTIAASLRLIHP